MIFFYLSICIICNDNEGAEEMNFVAVSNYLAISVLFFSAFSIFKTRFAEVVGIQVVFIIINYKYYRRNI